MSIQFFACYHVVGNGDALKLNAALLREGFDVQLQPLWDGRHELRARVRLDSADELRASQVIRSSGVPAERVASLSADEQLPQEVVALLDD